MTNTERIQANNAELREAIELAENLPDAGSGGTPTPTQEKTVDITENGTHTVTPDDGYVLSKVTATVNVPTGEDVTDETADYTSKLETLGTAIASLEAELRGKASGETQAYGFLDDTLTTIDSEALIVVQYACRYLKNLKMVNLPECTNIGGYAFQGCSNLTSINAPKLTTVASYSFNDSGLVSIDFPSLNPVTSYSFSGCAALKKADFGRAGTIGGSAFLDATVLETLILRKSDEICKLNNVNSLNNTPIANGTGYIYVPAALVESYKSATNWSTYAAQIRAIEDYPDICGGDA